MLATELYAQLLGLQPPWQVVAVTLDAGQEQVDVRLVHEPGARFPCPKCGVLLPIYDHAPARTWRCRDSCRYRTVLHAALPRMACRQHGVRQVAAPWAAPASRFTDSFEAWAIAVLLKTDVQGAAQLLRISWDQAWGIMERAVARGQRRKRRRVVPYLGIDEKSVGKGQDYFTLVIDLRRSTVEYIGEGRSAASLDGFYAQLTAKQLAGIQAIAMDMWRPYFCSTCEHVPLARTKIVFDRYHVMTHMNEAVDTVRKQEHRALRARGDETLSGTKYLWLFAAENLPEGHQERFALLQRCHLKTSRAWALKEMLRDLWNYRRRGWARRHFESWYRWAVRCRLLPVRKVAQLMRAHLENVLTYFDHRITTAACEGLNSKIQAIKHSAFGFRNRDNFRTAIFFHCGGLKLFPATHKKVG